MRQLQASIQQETVALFPGITLTLFAQGVPQAAPDACLAVYCCTDGRLGWQFGNQQSVYLGAGDFLICAPHAVGQPLSLPDVSARGLCVKFELAALEQPLPPLTGAEVCSAAWLSDFCAAAAFLPLAGTMETDRIFAGLTKAPGPLQLASQKLSALQLLLYLYEMSPTAQTRLNQYQMEQVAVIRQIHEQLVTHMAQRFTIEALSRQYLMNATTLKEVFKSVYGDSIAAHMKEHRMQHAAELLQSTPMSLTEIARAVGYSSQGKFAAAFKAYFQISPKAFQRQTNMQLCASPLACCEAKDKMPKCAWRLANTGEK